MKVLYRLQKEGYDAYLVGGCVRDLLLGREPKDFDVATNADPTQIKRIFRNCRIIGRRFRLAHVHFGRDVIEVATFRGDSDSQSDLQVLDVEGRLLRDNIYGSIEEDVWRRDFTVNALYYRLKDFAVIDYVGGMADLNAGTLKLIGNPDTRFREDPVRMLRAVRFAVKLGFNLDAECQKGIHSVVDQLNSIPSARLYDETLKLFMSGYALQTFEMLSHYGLFKVLFPSTEKSLSSKSGDATRQLVVRALQNSDNRIAEGKTVTAYFLFAALLWEPVQMRAKAMMAQGVGEYMAYQDAANDIINKQVKSTALPRHITMAMREVWNFQSKFDVRVGSKPSRLITHPRFRAGYDFLLLRSETGGASPELAEWWGRYQVVSETEQRAMTQPLRNGTSNKPKRKYNNRKRTKPADSGKETSE
ncbi:poly(A) polymerase I [Crenothrix polyspora]|uniref:Poly(A) polymerase I n=1 Tax=Crenothrix polyspora TaxID=360316 RepID=A0A1R4HIB8_9GAMM|nr:poly(A) polymerase I [Crenothrix polyspora]